ncbi:PPR: pentatricopeptide repeat domain containing protein [Nitzschia inconspicua]|uniref:PPR: pentatricopeptide repeat domain containing protein n=1 Tax=Nitzschia inconspicua TaxID=303405 RepID=A0A9K3PIH0_9STRA|nr:PPR: pentatricopeptide repeat domain containing protein [Nitzschia inconspicua]
MACVVLFIFVDVLLIRPLTALSLFQNKLLVRQLRSQPSNVTLALEAVSQVAKLPCNVAMIEPGLYERNVDEEAANNAHLVAVEAIRVCGKANDPDKAIRIFEQLPSEATRTMIISVLGGCQRHEEAVELLNSPLLGRPSAASYNAAIAACGKAKDWQLALHIFEENMPPNCKSIVTVNALLTVLANCKQGLQALELYRSIGKSGSGKHRAKHTDSDTVTRQLVISALTRSGNLDEACQLLEEFNCTSEKPSTALLDLVVAAFTQTSNWKGVERVERLRKDDSKGSNGIVEFHHWEGLERVDSSWKIGTYGALTVGVRPNRNPAQNGIKLMFYEDIPNDDPTGKKRRLRKVGYLLMKNSISPEPTSSLLGMFLDPTDRGQGMAKSCLAIWVLLCLQGNLIPVTGIIRKPLLALILQHTFQFVPISTKDSNGVLAELCRDPFDDRSVVLYSAALKSLEGAFSNRDLKQQNIKLSSEKPTKPGRLVKIICPLNPPENLQLLQSTCYKILSEEGWNCDLTGFQIQSVFLGRPMDSSSGQNTNREGEPVFEEESKRPLVLGQNKNN